MNSNSRVVLTACINSNHPPWKLLKIEEVRVRKQLLVQPRFQRWFLFWFMLCTSSLLACVGGGIYLWCKIVDETIFKLVGLISPSAMTLIKLNSDTATKVFAGLAFVIVSLALFQALIFSRKIAGPLFAFLRHLKKCEKMGRLERFSLRKGDLFTELAESFNRVVDMTNAKSLPKTAYPTKLRLIASKRR